MRGCSKAHKGRDKIICKREKEYKFRFCDTHYNTSDLSSEKTVINPLYIVVIISTLLFVGFLAFSNIALADFTFLDVRQRMLSQQAVEFEDDGFEEFRAK